LFGKRTGTAIDPRGAPGSATPVASPPVAPVAAPAALPAPPVRNGGSSAAAP
jgi:hypothetical protein